MKEKGNILATKKPNSFLSSGQHEQAALMNLQKEKIIAKLSNSHMAFDFTQFIHKRIGSLKFKAVGPRTHSSK
jgi:hypothetical protein